MLLRQTRADGAASSAASRRTGLRWLLTALSAGAVLVAMSIYLAGCSDAPVLDPVDDGVLPQAVAPAWSSPAVRIVAPQPGVNPAQVPPVFTVRWEAEGAKRIRWALVSLYGFGGSAEAAVDYLRDNENAPEWSEWTKYRPRKEEGTYWQSPPQDFGEYVFAVQVANPRGDTSAIALHESAIHLLVSNRISGPALWVGNAFIGTTATATLDTPPTIVDIPSGVRMDFTVRASAEAYGGVVLGYRYGWDLTDPDDDLQWEIDFTPFTAETVTLPAKTFYFGSHTLYVEVIDNSGFKTRQPIVLNIAPMTVERPLLVIDDWNEGATSGWEATRGAVPSDVEHDAFWLDMVSDVEGFDPAQDVVELQPNQIPPITLLVGYKSVIWNARGNYAYNGTSIPVLGELIKYRDPKLPVGPGHIMPNIVALYMAAGGHMLLCGEQLMTLSVETDRFVPAQYPIMLRYEMGGQPPVPPMAPTGENAFPYRDACLSVLDIAYISNPQRVRHAPLQCPVTGLRVFDPQGDGVRACDPVSASSGFPRLELRPEVAAPGRFYDESRAGLNGDIYNPRYFETMTSCGSILDYRRGCFEPIYLNECANTTSVIYGDPVAYWTSVYGNVVPDGGSVAARSVIWGLSPAYFKPDQVKGAMDVIFFDEWRLDRVTAAASARERDGGAAAR